MGRPGVQVKGCGTLRGGSNACVCVLDNIDPVERVRWRPEGRDTPSGGKITSSSKVILKLPYGVNYVLLKSLVSTARQSKKCHSLIKLKVKWKRTKVMLFCSDLTLVCLLVMLFFQPPETVDSKVGSSQFPDLWPCCIQK